MPLDDCTVRTYCKSAGTYKLGVLTFEERNSTRFVASDIPSSTYAVHQYAFDQALLSLGERGVTVNIDSEGDGTFDHNFTALASLSQSGYLRSFVDLDKDGKIGIVDVAIVARAYSTVPSSPRWNAQADLDKNDKVDIVDVTMVAKEFGKTV
jgi:hypothetical protein